MLEGIRVLDLTRLLPGALCTLLLSDLGAEVIKIEDTGSGDYMREIDKNLFNVLNRGKKSVSINLKSSEGLDLFYKLVKVSHVIVESFRPGVTKKLKIDYERVKRINENIVYCSLTGYGIDNCLSERSGHDLNYVAITGLLSKEISEKNPQVLPTQIADISGSLFALIGILAKLKEGKGGFIEVSMTETALIFNIFNLYSRNLILNGLYPCYNVYKCRDGYFTLGALEAKFWQNFCNAMGLQELRDKAYDEESVKVVQDKLKEMSKEEIEKTLRGKDIPYSFVASIKEVLESKFFKMRGRDFEEGKINPLVINGSRPHKDGNPPDKGMNTKEILNNLGYSETEIRKLRDLGVIHY